MKKPTEKPATNVALFIRLKPSTRAAIDSIVEREQRPVGAVVETLLQDALDRLGSDYLQTIIDRQHRAAKAAAAAETLDRQKAAGAAPRGADRARTR